MSKDSLVLHFAREGVLDKVEKVTNSLNHKISAPKLRDGDMGSVNMMDFCQMHGYWLTGIAKWMGKKVA